MINTFVYYILFQAHNVNSRAVRFRCCQLINKILNNLGDDAQIDDDLYDKIYQCMLERLRDKEPVVRFHAVMALARLQDPKDENCPIIKGIVSWQSYWGVVCSPYFLTDRTDKSIEFWFLKLFILVCRIVTNICVFLLWLFFHN